MRLHTKLFTDLKAEKGVMEELRTEKVRKDFVRNENAIMG